MESPELIPNGAPLDLVTGLTAPQRQLLASLWITTAQELVSLYASSERARRLLSSALKLDRMGLDALVVAARAILPATRDVASDHLAQEVLAVDFGMGALLTEPPDITAARNALPPYKPAQSRTVLPVAHSLLDQLPPLRSQGPRATCVAHAALALREQLEMAAGAPSQINLSEQYVYWWCKANDGLPAVAGSYLSLGLRCLETVGAPLEDAWRYNRMRTVDEGQGPPPENVSAGDPAFRTLRTLPLNRTDIHGIKTCLYEGRSVAFSAPVYHSWYKSNASLTWGKITLPLPGESYDGGHAMTLVGYQDNEFAPGGGYFLVRNSWQPWAWQGVWRSGYGYIPYAYITGYASAVFSAERISSAPPYLRGAQTSTPNVITGSPYIWLRHHADAGATDEPPQPGSENALYAMVTNPGPAHIYAVRIAFFYKRAGQGVSANWEQAGEFTAAWLRPGDNVIGPLSWTPPHTGPFVWGVRFVESRPAAKDTSLAQ